eukprot:g2112.t1
MSHQSIRRGAFILFEGIDRCGKTTQSKLLAETLRKEGSKIEMMRFPDRTTTVGKMIDAYLKMGIDLHDKAIHLLFSANRWELATKIETLLSGGTTIICDRYAYSGVAFSGSKPGMNIDWCKNSDDGLPSPDCVIFLDIDTEATKGRGGFGEERYEKADMQKRVRKNFSLLQTDAWHVLDATKSIESLAKDIQKIAKKSMHLVAQKPIGRLWK